MTDHSSHNSFAHEVRDDLAEPNGLENLKAILADQPYRNSAISVHEIEVILANDGGFMPDEAVLWFRASRGKLGQARAEALQALADIDRDLIGHDETMANLDALKVRR